MTNALALAASSALIPSIVGAVGSLLAAGIAAWAVLRAQSYRQLLHDIQEIVATVLEKQLAAEQRGPQIARYVEDMMRRVLQEMAGASDHGRRWYDR